MLRFEPAEMNLEPRYQIYPFWLWKKISRKKFATTNTRDQPKVCYVGLFERSGGGGLLSRDPI